MSKIVKRLTIIKKDIVLPSVSSNELTEKEHIMSKTEYDKKGQVLSEISYTSEGKASHAYTYSYDDDFLVEEKLVENDEIIERKTFEAGENKTIKKEYRHYIDNTYDTIEYIYNDTGNLIEKITRDYDGDIEQRERFDYKGEKLIKETVFDEDDTIISEKTVQYDEDERIAETESYDPLEETRFNKVTKYDEKGNPKETLTYDKKDKLIERIQFEHDDQGRVTKVIEENQNKKNTIKMKYDDNGNLILQEEYDRNNKLINKVERTFDNDNRVLEARAFMEIAERNIIRNYMLKYDYEYFEQ